MGRSTTARPFANGLPHYGHLLTGYAKDVFPRFQTMRGKQVHRRFGWDTHGLPAELEAMRQLGITEKSQIEAMGIAAFNQAARESVLRYTQEWQEYVTRQARWVDFENDYKTLDITFMESVIWAFKQLHDKGLAYEGYRVLPYCWHDETPLSNHELRMDDDVYKMRQDQTVTVTFPLVGPKAEALGLTAVRALAWTTTPWTLPTNLALAVGPDIEYAVVPSGPLGAGDGAEEGVAEYLLATDTLARLLQGPRLRIRRGSARRGIPHRTSAPSSRASTTTGSGTTTPTPRSGAPRTPGSCSSPTTSRPARAPASCTRLPPTVRTTSSSARPRASRSSCRSMTAASSCPDVAPVAGLQVFDANKPLTQLLRAEGRLLQVTSYEHSYPHCWRCRNPLIYKAVSSWFVRVPEFRDRMGELNEQINWVPDNVKHGQFGKWLADARDWSISRNRYWGSPDPGVEERQPRVPARRRVRLAGRARGATSACAPATDLHRPYIDELTRPNPDDPTGKSTMRRIEDVLDVWFDSGSMPFAQVHYPFENREWFDSHNPADFIVEYIGQTRGWFYTMHVLVDRAVRPSGVQERDQPRHRARQRRAEDVEEPAQLPGCLRGLRPGRRGCDALVPDVVLGHPRRQPGRHRGGHSRGRAAVPAAAVEHVLLLHPVCQRRRLPGQVAHRLHERARPLPAREDPRRSSSEVTVDLEALDSPMAAAKLRDFADVLTNWYVRRSRDRFWGGDDTDAFDTLYTVLETVTRVAAPLVAAGHRGDLARAHRRAQRAPDRLAGCWGLPRRRPARGDHGPGAGDRIGRSRAAQDAGPPGASAARGAHRGRRAVRSRGLQRHPARRAQRQDRAVRAADRAEPQ